VLAWQAIEAPSYCAKGLVFDRVALLEMQVLASTWLKETANRVQISAGL